MLDRPQSSPMANGPTVAHEDEEANAEPDEPPELDTKLHFTKICQPDPGNPKQGSELILSPHTRKASLLTQALLTSPELTPLSDSETTLPMSDGGILSPPRTVTPSPPASLSKGVMEFSEGKTPVAPMSILSAKDAATLEQSEQARPTPVSTVEEALGRKRCISFACGRKSAAANASDHHPVKQATAKSPAADGAPTRRPCMLRFACLSKPARSESQSEEVQRLPFDNPHTELKMQNARSETRHPHAASVSLESRRDQSGNLPAESSFIQLSETKHPQPASRPFNRVDFQKSEATSFHEFAGPYPSEDEWTHEQIAYKQKLTIEDTLGKENAIRRLAAEAEAEALEEEEGFEVEDGGELEGLEDESDDNADDESAKDSRRSVLATSDDGNESDDEGGFAESDDGSDDGLGYQFWTPGVTTAATSTEHLEHVRPLSDRVASDSSLDIEEQAKDRRNSRASPGHRSKILKRTTTLPSAEGKAKFEDFIIGTLDEDRPEHEAYVSSFEQRKRSKQRTIPQDIDPSFPTSDPDDDDDDDGNESEDEETDDQSDKDDQNLTLSTQAATDDESDVLCRPSAHGSDRRPRNSPRQAHQARSPAPKHMFGNIHHRLRSPAPFARRIVSPPPSPRPSPPSGPVIADETIAVVTHLAQRPGLIRTASLPRSEKPFWGLHRTRSTREERRSGKALVHTVRDADVDLHPRGPIDIVQGLEHKRLRRKEKYWRLHCQKAHAGKEKERKCQRGKGVQRMAEVGREMQDRFKAYGHNRPNLMLSI